MRKNGHAARAARFLVQFFDVSLPNDDVSRIFIFEVLTTTRAQSSKSLVLCFYMKTIRAKQPKAYFAYFIQRDQHGIIAKHYNKRKALFKCDVSFAQPS